MSKIREAYDAVTERVHGGHARTYLLFWRLFEKDLDKIWARGGFVHCTKANQLLRRELIKRGVKAEDIRTRWTAVIISPHQYTQVKKDGEWIDVDPWGRIYGVPFGEHAGY